MTTNGDIERLFRTHYAAMYRLAMLILRDDEAARDIVQDIFETLLDCGLRHVSEGYLLVAVRNRCLKHIRSLSAHDRMRAAYSVDENEIESEDWPDDETIELIQSTVSSDLTDACRRVVDLRFAQGRSYQEIADALGISKVAVYKHLRHAMAVLRKKLSQNG